MGREELEEIYVKLEKRRKLTVILGVLSWFVGLFVGGYVANQFILQEGLRVLISFAISLGFGSGFLKKIKILDDNMERVMLVLDAMKERDSQNELYERFSGLSRERKLSLLNYINDEILQEYVSEVDNLSDDDREMFCRLLEENIKQEDIKEKRHDFKYTRRLVRPMIMSKIAGDNERK